MFEIGLQQSNFLLQQQVLVLQSIGVLNLQRAPITFQSAITY